VIRHQSERGQVVVDSGPYRVVRHPMYAGLVPVLAGIPLWLGSWAGLAAASVPVGVLAARIVVEERFLRAHLDGYEEYAQRVPFRMLPRIW
jgi:protein-S-isoprenylcysteine O-methyltransferase Ste14